MPQKLSAMKYIKNNKRRTAVLIVSLALCFTLTYLVQFILSSTTETFKPVCYENTQKMQFISLAGKTTLGIDADNLSDEEFQKVYKEKNLEVIRKLKEIKGVEEAYFAQVIYCTLTPPIGNLGYSVPLVDSSEIPKLMDKFNAKLIEGRLPQNPGELVLDKASMINNGFTLNGYFDEENYKDKIKIVGILDCDTYFACGTPYLTNVHEFDHEIIILSSGIDDMTEVLHQIGIDVTENVDHIEDYKTGVEVFKTDVTEAIKNPTRLIFIGIMVLLFIALTVVYTIYLRDRHNEWCLYSSIGYSHKTIYSAIMKELLFTFAAALLIGTVIICVSMLAIDSLIIESQGLRCKYFHPQTLFEILCTYILLIGVLQIPIRYALYRIRTIDAIEDDLY